MKISILSLFCWLACQSLLSAQEIVVIGGLENKSIHQQDSIVVMSTFGTPFIHTEIQNNLLVITTFNPFLFSSDSITTSSSLPILEGLVIFPNPTPDILVMQRKDLTEDFYVTVTDQTGRIVNDLIWPEGVGSYQPSFQSFPAGIYVISVTNQQKTKGNQYKIIKQ